MYEIDPIDITVPGSPDDPRSAPEIEGVLIHYVPSLHPDDVTVVDGIPVTTVARTLIDVAGVMSEAELRDCFVNARARGLLDPEELAASRARVEWRPSLALFDRVAAEFLGL